MNDPSRRLVIMRHAQAETVASSDHDRALTARGITAATETGRWLAEHGVVPDHALVSAARRTRQTWDAVAQGAGWELEPDIEPALYSAGSESVMDLLRLTPDGAKCVVVLGHNPTVSYLAQLISDGRGLAALHEEMARGFPPTASAVFDVTETWSSFALGDGRLVGFHVGVH
ncbi:SixA phosphatase family protein [Nocardioides gilvus]|uniref:SixA phosphatase family protein n=1 Tax=Nocardioides gilvus TaxID=1735589 RepID=UPI0013A5B198|nr:histidine phosphatase family protein [Nocardioides gilvus]